MNEDKYSNSRLYKDGVLTQHEFVLDVVNAVVQLDAENNNENKSLKQALVNNDIIVAGYMKASYENKLEGNQ